MRGTIKINYVQHEHEKSRGRVKKQQDTEYSLSDLRILK